MTSQISGRVLLASLTISKWYPRAFDERASQEVANIHGTDVGRFNKRLLPKRCPEYDAIGSIERRARAEFNKLTLAYDAFGVRLLPTKAYFDCTALIQNFRAEMCIAVDAFMRAYETDQPQISILERARSELNGLFRRSDYPAGQEVRSKFNCAANFLPFPDADAMNIALPDGAVDAIRQSMGASIDEATLNARAEMSRRLVGAVTHLAARLHAAGDGGRLHASALQAVQEEVATLPKLNFADDSALNEAITLASSLCNLDLDWLRKSSPSRSAAALSASSIATEIAAMFTIDLAKLSMPTPATTSPTAIDGDQRDLLAALA